MSDIAIVGLDGRFPGAPDPAAYWDLLMRGEHAISEVPDDRWHRDRFFDPAGGAGRTNTTVGGFLTDADAFDHEFFGISPREAEAMDPQQRLMLQTAWRAFEDAGLDPRSQAKTNTGVFVGVMSSEWAQLHMTDYDGITAHLGTGNGYCMIANRISYHLDLKGPSWAVDSACSSSLVATHQACVALRAGECDQALVGGVNIVMTPALNIFYSQAGLSASDGACKPFSRDATGIVRGEAVGAVVLRRLEDAVADGLPIYARITGGAVNQDGRSNGLTAPNRWSQQAVIAEAYRRAGVRPQDVAAVEAHGTGTVLGDLIEANALGAVHAVPRSQPCGVGSVKANIGHVEGAAGIASLIKMALALRHGVVPPSRHARTENPDLRLSAKGLRLLTVPLRLRGRESVVGVSSFGLGGTNAHLVLASAPAAPPRREEDGGGVLTVSADTPAGLRRNADRIARDVAAGPPGRLGQLCWTSNMVKSSGRHRLAIVAADREDVVSGLRAYASGEAGAPVVSGRAGTPVSLGWMFTGQGSQYPAMGRALHATSGAYRRALAAADEVLTPLLGTSIADIVLDGTLVDLPAELAQPALFAVGYAIGRVLDEVGARPDWLIGHSVGEYAAAVHAGALTLEDAARLLTMRARLMGELPDGGGMVAVRCALTDLQPLVADEPLVDVAAVNGPRDVVCSGSREALERIVDVCRGRGVATRWLAVSHAFHSPLMDPVLDRFAQFAATIPARPARRPLYSTLHGRLLRTDEVMDAGYWAAHIRRPVRFAEAVTAALAAGPSHLVEVGPKRILSSMVRQLSGARPLPTLAPYPGPHATGRELREVVARLHCDGLDPDWDVLYEPDQRVLRRLSPYAFSTANRFWAGVPDPDGADRAERRSRRTRDPEDVALDRMPDGPVSTDVDEFGDEVRGIVAEICGYDRHDVPPDALLFEELGYDSIMVVQLKARVEERWGLAVDGGELLPELTTPRRLIAFLRRHIQSVEAGGQRD